jgi:Tfp pilus assembly protein PilO
MNKLSKDKRDKFILTVIGAAGIIAVLYFLVITDQQAELVSTDMRISALKVKRDSSDRQTKRAAQTQAELDAAKKALVLKERDMPRPNTDHVWFLNIMAERRNRYNGRLDVDEIKTPEAVDAGVLPNFPYRALAMSVTMVGTYQDCGAFIADLENSYPYMRVQLQNVVPELRSSAPGARSNPGEEDKLRFQYRVITLVKSVI